LVLETPNYDSDTGVWGVEVDVLNRLSRLTISGAGADASLDLEPPETDQQLQEWAEEISAAVKLASNLKDAKNAKAAASKSGSGRRSRKKKPEEEEKGEPVGIRAKEAEDQDLSDLSELSDLTVEEEAQL
jgi:hypothetical protein